MEHDARILGGGDFVAEILKEADQKLRRQIKGEGKADSIEVILQKVCSEEGVKGEDLKMGNRNRKVSQVRAKVAYRLNHELGIPKAEIARHLGVCTSAIAKAVRNLES
jgi:chromosomal replication initiation ATPase DnaA